MLSFTSMMAISLFLSLATLLMLWKLLRDRIGRPVACGLALLWCVLLILFQLLFDKPVVLIAFYQLIFTFPLLLFGLIRSDTPRLSMGLAVGIMIATYAYNFRDPINEWLEIRDLRHEHPFISLSGRLSYEKKVLGSDLRSSSAAPVPLPADLEERLARFEAPKRILSVREYALRQVHDRAHADFALQRGFGPMRMGWFREDNILLPNLPLIPHSPPTQVLR